MKSTVIVCSSLLCSSLMGINLAHAKTCVITQTTAVKEAVNGKTVGQLRANTTVNTMSYDSDTQGNILAYVTWQGQPLASVKRPDLKNQGWVARNTINCSD